MYKNLYVIIFGCAVCLTIFYLCFSGTSSLSGGAQRRADYTWNNATEPQTLDPGLMSGQPEGELAEGLFEGLTNYHPATLRPLPGVAISWETDGLQYRFILRKDAYWVRRDQIFTVNGQPRRVVANDFVYSWRRHLHPETGSEYSYLLHLILGAQEYAEQVSAHWKEMVQAYERDHSEVVLVDPTDLLPADRENLWRFRDELWERTVGINTPDDEHLNITLKSPAPYFLDLTSFYPMRPTPREPIETHGKEWILPENIVTNGSYYLDDWRFNSYVRLRKNLHYWETDEYVSRRVAELESKPSGQLREPERRELDYLRGSGAFVEHGLAVIDALAVEELNTGLNLYLNGDVDRVRELPNEIKAEMIVESQRPERPLRHVQYGSINSVYYYCVNMQLPLFRAGPNGELGRKLRRALSLTIDRQALVDFVTRANERPAYRLVPPGVMGYSDLPYFGSGDFERDVEEAKRLVAEVRAAGVRIPRLKILYNTLESHAKIAAFIQHLWSEHLGIEITLANQEWGVFLDARRTGNFEIARQGWIGDYTDPNTFLDMFTEGNQNNDPRYSNPHYDRVVVRYCAYILDHLETPETRRSLLDDVRSWPHYDETVRRRQRPDGKTLDAALELALEEYARAPEPRRLDRAFAVRLLLFEIAEEMLLFDMPVIPFYFYTRTQLRDPELEGFSHNTRDIHPLKTLRWKGGRRTSGPRYREFPRLSTRD